MSTKPTTNSKPPHYAAAKTKGSITLTLKGESRPALKLARLMAQNWDDFSDAEFERVLDILEERRTDKS